MSISDIENVGQKVELVEPVEIVPLNLDEPEKIIKIRTRFTLTKKEQLLEFLRANKYVFAWTIDEMLGIPTKFVVHKLSIDPTRRPIVQKCRLFSPEKQAAIDEEIYLQRKGLRYPQT